MAILGDGNTTKFSRSISRQARHSPLSITCEFSSQGKLIRKKEISPLGNSIFHYAYDEKGHLTEVGRNGAIVEKYAYDASGKRIEDFRAWDGATRQFIYDYTGALIRHNDAYFEWTPRGQLKSIYSGNKKMELEYGSDTRLDQAFLPSGITVQYRYDNELMPVMVMENYEPVYDYG